MKYNLFKKSIFSIVLGGTALFSAVADAEISAEGRAAGQAAAAASTTVNGKDAQHAGVSSATRAAVSGNAGVRADENAIRGSVKRNGSAAAKSSVKAAHDTVESVQQSGRVVRQEAVQASRSVSVNGDADALANGAVIVETGDGITVDLSSATSGNTGVRVQPADGKRAVSVIRGEGASLGANAEGTISEAAQAAASSARNMAGDARGAASADFGLTADIGSGMDIQQDISSTVESSVEEGVAQSRSAADAAIDAAAEVAAETQTRTDAVVEETNSLSADATGDFELNGEGVLGL